MDPIAILLLAAGASSRMRGADKLLELIDGVPVLRRQAVAAQTCEVSVFVALPPDRPARTMALDGLDLVRVTVADAAQGMSASIRAGLAALPGATAGVAILPADMPEITADDLRKVLNIFDAAGRKQIVRATTQDGTPGHPVVFPARLFPELRALSGDQGARAVLQCEDIVAVPLPARHALTDLDTPEDWEIWRAAQNA